MRACPADPAACGIMKDRNHGEESMQINVRERVTESFLILVMFLIFRFL